MAKKSKTGLPHVKSVTSKGTQYLYFDTGQRDEKGKRVYKALPPLKDKTFGSVYATLLGHRSRRAVVEPLLTVKGLIALYQKSPKWRDLSDGSRNLYGYYLAELERLVGNAPANELARDDVVLMVDKRADMPGAANMLLRTTGALYSWGRDRGHVSVDPCKDIRLLKLGEHIPWPEQLVAQALSDTDERIRLAVHLLYYTAQRIGDVMKMQFGDIEDGVLFVKQQKTGRELYVPLHKALRDELKRQGRQIGPIIVGATGAPIKQDSVRQYIKLWTKDRGHNLAAHGLRKNAVNALLEAGCTVAQTASISGQTLQMVEHYAKMRDQKRLAKQAMETWESQ